MADFDAGLEVEDLTFDFTKFGGSKGTIPEPTRKQVRAYGRFIRGRLGKGTTPDNLEDKIEELSDDELEKLEEEAAIEVAALCSGHPSAEEIIGLQFRVAVKFYSWIWRQMTDPRLSSAGTKLSAVAQTNGSSGV